MAPPAAGINGSQRSSSVTETAKVIDMWAGALDEFRRWGLAVMLVEYPGYGRSDGSPSEAGS